MLDVTSHRSTTLKRLKPCRVYTHLHIYIYNFNNYLEERGGWIKVHHTVWKQSPQLSHAGQEMNFFPPVRVADQYKHNYYFTHSNWTLFDIEADLILISHYSDKMVDRNTSQPPQSSFINIHWLVFISCPEHMQITPDAEGYLSTGYSRSTYRTNIGAGNPGQGHSLMTWKCHQFLKTAKRCCSTHSKIQQMGTWLTAEPHSTGIWQQTDRVRVWTVAALLSSSTVQSSRRKRRRSMWGQRTDDGGFLGLKCLRPKRTEDSLKTGNSSLGGFPAQREHECVGFSLQTELAFIYIYHSSSFQTSMWARHGKCNTTADI